jgi:hypothetical protein
MSENKAKKSSETAGYKITLLLVCFLSAVIAFLTLNKNAQLQNKIYSYKKEIKAKDGEVKRLMEEVAKGKNVTPNKAIENFFYLFKNKKDLFAEIKKCRLDKTYKCNVDLSALKSLVADYKNQKEDKVDVFVLMSRLEDYLTVSEKTLPTYFD